MNKTTRQTRAKVLNDKICTKKQKAASQGSGSNCKRRAYCFTWNNYPVNWSPLLEDSYKLIKNNIVYLVGAPEIAPSTGTPHIQGYVYFKNERSMKGVQTYVWKGYGIALKEANGTAQENRKYIVGPYKKDGKEKPMNPDYIEFGEIPEQGKRKDLDQLFDDVRTGVRTVENIISEQPLIYHQYGRTLNALEDIRMLSQHRNFMTRGLWIWGKSGIGKSHEAFKNYSHMTHYSHNLNDNGWWDGYRQQDIVVFNEFRGQIAFGELLDLVDWVPKTVKRRNRQPIPFMSKLVIITSSMPPEEIYHNVFDKQNNTSHENTEQFYRRFFVEQKCSKGNIDLSRFLISEAEEKEIMDFVSLAPAQEFEEF